MACQKWISVTAAAGSGAVRTASTTARDAQRRAYRAMNGPPRLGCAGTIARRRLRWCCGDPAGHRRHHLVLDAEVAVGREGLARLGPRRLPTLHGDQLAARRLAERAHQGDRVLVRRGLTSI